MIPVSLLKRLCGGCFASETAVQLFQFQKRNGHLDPKVVKKNPLELIEISRYNSFSRRGR
jgi:hypothetical protein